MQPSILLIEDDDSTRFGFVRYFSKEGYQIYEAATLSDAKEAISNRTFDAIILDITLPDGNGIDFITSVRAIDSSIPIIVITGAGNIPLAVKAMRCGANNFLTKPVDMSSLGAFVRKIFDTGFISHHLTSRKRLERHDGIFFGITPAMHEVLQLAQSSTSNDSPVLIMGETGTGKGELARWIHRQSARAAHEFVEINCSGLRGDMLSRELFGNVRGAYTSANQDRNGLLDLANRGTLFLDEIGDMELITQAQFLKVLEDKSYRRLGDVKLLRSDFRLICATNYDIETLVSTGRFRQDLMYRINLMSITIPPLRERVDDLPALVSYLLRELGSLDTVISKNVMSILTAYSWPGNIRELKNVLERALMLTPPGSALSQSSFSSLVDSHHRQNEPNPLTIQELEKLHIKSVMNQMGGDVAKASEILNISRTTIYRRLKLF